MFRSISFYLSDSLVAWCIFLIYPSRQISCVRPPWCPLVCVVTLRLRCFNYSQYFVYKHFHRGKGFLEGRCHFHPLLHRFQFHISGICHISPCPFFCGFSLTLTNTDPNTGFIRRASLMTCENEVMFTHLPYNPYILQDHTFLHLITDISYHFQVWWIPVLTHFIFDISFIFFPFFFSSR